MYWYPKTTAAISSFFSFPVFSQKKIAVSSLLSPTLNKIHKVEKTLLVSPYLRRSIDCLNPELLIVVSELPIICPAPSKRTYKLYSILPNGFEALIKIGLVVLGTGAVKFLVSLGFLGLSEDGEAKFGYGDGVAPGVVEVGEVGAEVGGGDVDIGLAAVAKVPAGGGGLGLCDAVWA